MIIIIIIEDGRGDTEIDDRHVFANRDSRDLPPSATRFALTADAARPAGDMISHQAARQTALHCTHIICKKADFFDAASRFAFAGPGEKKRLNPRKWNEAWECDQ